MYIQNGQLKNWKDFESEVTEKIWSEERDWPHVTEKKHTTHNV